MSCTSKKEVKPKLFAPINGMHRYLQSFIYLFIDLAAEHLQPGESYLEAAVRGLQEELTITLEPQQLEKYSTFN